MSIFVDKLFSSSNPNFERARHWSYMWSDSSNHELHSMAKILGISKDFVVGNCLKTHYVISPSKRYLALGKGAKNSSFLSFIEKNSFSLERVFYGRDF